MIYDFIVGRTLPENKNPPSIEGRKKKEEQKEKEKRQQIEVYRGSELETEFHHTFRFLYKNEFSFIIEYFYL